MIPRRAVLAAGGAGLAALALSGCFDSAVPAPEGALSFVAYGDSLTAGHRRRLAFGEIPDDTWLAYTGRRMIWVGGAAVSGATAQLLPGMVVKTPPADVGLYFFGTNDRRHGRTVAAMVEDITGTHASIPADSRPKAPCLVAIGPQGHASLTGTVDAWNHEVRAAARDLGWGFLDPWYRLRANAALGGAGQWASTPIHRDQLHPTVAGAKLLGQGMTDAVKQLKQA